MSVAEMSSAQEIAAADVLRKLAIVWTDFEARLEATPLIRKLTRGRFELADYHAFLVNMRQQVKDGSLWMSRAASSIDEEHLELRSSLMSHAVTEHRDFRMLETDYVASGGKLILYRGTTDGLIPYGNTVSYYESVVAKLGADAVRDRVALYLVPGMDHCAGGEGASAIDWIDALERFDTSGKPPSALAARHPVAPAGFPGAPATPSLAEA